MTQKCESCNLFQKLCNTCDNQSPDLCPDLCPTRNFQYNLYCSCQNLKKKSCLETVIQSK